MSRKKGAVKTHAGNTAPPVEIQPPFGYRAHWVFAYFHTEQPGGGTGAAVWLCSAVWLGNNGIWLQSGWHDFLQSGSVFGCSLAVFGCFWPPFSPFCLFGLQSGSVVFAVWLFFVAVWLFLASQTARAEPDCKTTEPDCKSGSQTAKKKSQTTKKLQSGSLQSGYTTRVVGNPSVSFFLPARNADNSTRERVNCC